MTKTSFTLVIIALLIQLNWGQSSSSIKIHHCNTHEIIIAVDSNVHNNYGLQYPMTYKIDIHSDTGSLKTYKKYHTNEPWILVQEKTQNDFFNDIEAARFDYSSRKAFVSIAFSSTSDSVFIKICDAVNNNIPIQFSEITKYYDDRNSVVATTADDWKRSTLNQFNQAISFFRDRKLWISGAIITDSTWAADSVLWNAIQKQLDSGYVEAVSHSRNHLNVPYDYESEVIGSKNDIIRNLNLPALSSKGNKEYVYVYVHPYGEWNDEIDYVAGSVNYLVTRGVYAYHFDFTPWNPLKNIYERMDVACELGPLWGGITDLPTLNSLFDEAVQNKALYHFYIHPQVLGNYNVWDILTQHLDYISGKKNIWYSAFGYIVLYHFLQESTILFTPPKIISTPITSIILGQQYHDTLHIDSYPEPKYYLDFNPTGMLLDSISGIITWTPNSLGIFAVKVRAVNKWGSDTLSYNITVNGTPPVITTTPITVGNTLQQYVYDVDASGAPAPKYCLVSNPSGMLIDSISGMITWTPLDSGRYNVVVKAANGILPDAMQSYLINVELAIAPMITRIPDTTAILGKLHLDTIRASGFPSAKYNLNISPRGMMIDSMSGVINWIPDSLGIYAVEAIASNKWGSDTLSFNITVEGIAPVITTSPVTEGNTLQQYVYDVDASGAPAPKYYLVSSPIGMAIDSISGIITWTPPDSGSYNVTVKAANDILPDAVQSYTIGVELAIVPVIRTIADTTAIVGQLHVDTIKASGYPAAKYYLNTSPSGMTLNSISGVINWTPDLLGTYSVEVRAENKWGSDTLSYSIVIEGIAPVITSLPDTSGRTGQLYRYDVDASGTPIPRYYLETSPSGMVIDSLSGEILWIPANGGYHSVTVKAFNGVNPPSIQSFSILVLDITNCAANMIAYWKLNETSGKTYLDFYSGNNAVAGIYPPSPVKGKVNGGQQFDGFNDEINVPANTIFDFNSNDNFSVEFWIKRLSTVTERDADVVIGRTDGGSLMRWWIGIDNGGKVTFQLRSKIGESFTVKGTSSLNDSLWHHITAMRDGDQNQLRIFVDGKQEGSTSANYSSGFDSPNANITIGWLSIGLEYAFNGIIDEIAIYNDLLDSMTVKRHYAGGNAGKDFCDKCSLLSVKLMLEGMYDSVSTLMKTTLNSILPTISPYTEDPRILDSIPSNAIDWMLLELRTDSHASPSFITSVLLDENGFLLSDDGSNSGLIFEAVENCYIVVKHRNSIETWSSSKLNFNSEHISYDFTSYSSKAYGCNMIKKGNRWCIFSGDVNRDGAVDSADLSLIGNEAFNFLSGYLPTDLNGDGYVDLDDLVICDNNVFKSVEVKKPLIKLLGKSSNVSKAVEAVIK